MYGRARPLRLLAPDLKPRPIITRTNRARSMFPECAASFQGLAAALRYYLKDARPHGSALARALGGHGGLRAGCLDVLLYVFVVQTLRAEFHWSAATAGLVSSATLILLALGGIGAGFLSDRIGRSRTLVSPYWFIPSAPADRLCSTGLRNAVRRGDPSSDWDWAANGRPARCWWRKLAAETSRQSHRADAIRVGARATCWRPPSRLSYCRVSDGACYFSPDCCRAADNLDPAQGEGAADLDRETRRQSLVRSVPSAAGRRTILATALATCMLFAYWGLNTWLPGFLSAPRSQGGAGLNVLQTSAWIFTMQFGTFLGYASFGWLADWWGRRPAFFVYVIDRRRPHAHLWTHAACGPARRRKSGCLILGPLVGFFGTGFFSLFGAMLAETVSHFHSRLGARLRL